jgi:hypothetical protein
MHSPTIKNQPQAEAPTFAKRATSGIISVLSLFSNGISRLCNSRMDRKTAAIMTTMCVPALLFSAIMTIPGMVFQSPDQNAYYYFARTLENDPVRWIVLLLCGLCTVLSVTVPALDHDNSGLVDH